MADPLDVLLSSAPIEDEESLLDSLAQQPAPSSLPEAPESLSLLDQLSTPPDLTALPLTEDPLDWLTHEPAEAPLPPAIDVNQVFPITPPEDQASVEDTVLPRRPVTPKYPMGKGLLTPEQVKLEAERQGPWTWENTLAQEWGPEGRVSKIPLVGIAADALNSTLPAAIQLLQDNGIFDGMTPETQKQLREFVVNRANEEAVKTERKKGLNNWETARDIITTIVSGIPTYAAEFFLTKGVGTAARLGAMGVFPAAKKLLAVKSAEMLKQMLAENYVKRKTLESVSDAATRELAKTAMEKVGTRAGYKALRGIEDQGVYEAVETLSRLPRGAEKRAVDELFKKEAFDALTQVERNSLRAADWTGKAMQGLGIAGFHAPAVIAERLLPELPAAGIQQLVDKTLVAGGVTQTPEGKILIKGPETGMEAGRQALQAVANDFVQNISEFMGGPVDRLVGKVFAKAAKSTAGAAIVAAARKVPGIKPLLESPVTQRAKLISKRWAKNMSDVFQVQGQAGEAAEEAYAAILTSIFNLNRDTENKPIGQRLWDTATYPFREPLQVGAMVAAFGVFPMLRHVGATALGLTHPYEAARNAETMSDEELKKPFRQGYTTEAGLTKASEILVDLVTRKEDAPMRDLWRWTLEKIGYTPAPNAKPARNSIADLWGKILGHAEGTFSYNAMRAEILKETTPEARVAKAKEMLTTGLGVQVLKAVTMENGQEIPEAEVIKYVQDSIKAGELIPSKMAGRDKAPELWAPTETWGKANEQQKAILAKYGAVVTEGREEVPPSVRQIPVADLRSVPTVREAFLATRKPEERAEWERAIDLMPEHNETVDTISIDPRVRVGPGKGTGAAVWAPMYGRLDTNVLHMTPESTPGDMLHEKTHNVFRWNNKGTATDPDAVAENIRANMKTSYQQLHTILTNLSGTWDKARDPRAAILHNVLSSQTGIGLDAVLKQAQLKPNITAEEFTVQFINYLAGKPTGRLGRQIRVAEWARKITEALKGDIGSLAGFVDQAVGKEYFEKLSGKPWAETFGEKKPPEAEVAAEPKAKSVAEGLAEKAVAATPAKAVGKKTPPAEPEGGAKVKELEPKGPPPAAPKAAAPVKREAPPKAVVVEPPKAVVAEPPKAVVAEPPKAKPKAVAAAPAKVGKEQKIGLVEKAIRAVLPKPVADAVLVRFFSSRKRLPTDAQLSVKSHLAKLGITDPLAINWVLKNQTRVKLGSLKAPEELVQFALTAFKAKQDTAQYPALQAPYLRDNFKEWGEVLRKTYEANPFFQDMMMDVPLKEITNPRAEKPSVPPVSKVVLRQVYDYALQHPNDLGLAKLYQKMITTQAAESSEHEKSASGKGHWVHVPQARPLTPQHKANVELLRRLSPATWCTHDWNAPTSVERYDNYILVVDGKTVAGLEVIPEGDGAPTTPVLFDATSIANNGIASIDWLDDTVSFLDKHNIDYSLADSITRAKLLKQQGKTDRDVSKEDYYGPEEDFRYEELEPDETPEQHVMFLVNQWDSDALDVINALNSEEMVAQRKYRETGELPPAGFGGIPDFEGQTVSGMVLSGRAAGYDANFLALLTTEQVDQMRQAVERQLGIVERARRGEVLALNLIAHYVEGFPPGDMPSSSPVQDMLLGMLSDTSRDPTGTIVEKAGAAAKSFQGTPGEFARKYLPVSWYVFRESGVVELTPAGADSLRSRSRSSLRRDLYPNHTEAVQAFERWLVDHQYQRERMTLDRWLDMPDPGHSIMRDLGFGKWFAWRGVPATGPVLADEGFPFSLRSDLGIEGYATGVDAVVNAAVVSEEDAPKVALHEVAHLGMIRLAKDLGGFNELHTILKSAKSELMKAVPELLKRTGHTSLDALIQDYGFDPKSPEGEVKLLMELAARWAERFATRPRTIWWTNLIKNLQRWVKRFTGIDMTEREVDRLVAGFVRYGSVPQAAAKAPPVVKPKPVVAAPVKAIPKPTPPKPVVPVAEPQPGVPEQETVDEWLRRNIPFSYGLGWGPEGVEQDPDRVEHETNEMLRDPSKRVSQQAESIWEDLFPGTPRSPSNTQQLLEFARDPLFQDVSLSQEAWDKFLALKQSPFTEGSFKGKIWKALIDRKKYPTMFEVNSIRDLAQSLNPRFMAGALRFSYVEKEGPLYKKLESGNPVRTVAAKIMNQTAIRHTTRLMTDLGVHLDPDGKTWLVHLDRRYTAPQVRERLRAVSALVKDLHDQLLDKSLVTVEDAFANLTGVSASYWFAVEPTLLNDWRVIILKELNYLQTRIDHTVTAMAPGNKRNDPTGLSFLEARSTVDPLPSIGMHLVSIVSGEMPGITSFAARWLKQQGAKLTEQQKQDAQVASNQYFPLISKLAHHTRASFANPVEIVAVTGKRKSALYFESQVLKALEGAGMSYYFLQGIKGKGRRALEADRLLAEDIDRYSRLELQSVDIVDAKLYFNMWAEQYGRKKHLLFVRMPFYPIKVEQYQRGFDDDRKRIPIPRAQVVAARAGIADAIARYARDYEELPKEVNGKPYRSELFPSPAQVERWAQDPDATLENEYQFNYAVNRMALVPLLRGDLHAFKSKKDLIKRGDSNISPTTKPQVTGDPKGLNKKTRILVVVDAMLASLFSALDDKQKQIKEGEPRAVTDGAVIGRHDWMRRYAWSIGIKIAKSPAAMPFMKLLYSAVDPDTKHQMLFKCAVFHEDQTKHMAGSAIEAVKEALRNSGIHNWDAIVFKSAGKVFPDEKVVTDLLVYDEMTGKYKTWGQKIDPKMITETDSVNWGWQLDARAPIEARIGQLGKQLVSSLSALPAEYFNQLSSLMNQNAMAQLDALLAMPVAERIRMMNLEHDDPILTRIQDEHREDQLTLDEQGYVASKMAYKMEDFTRPLVLTNHLVNVPSGLSDKLLPGPIPMRWLEGQGLVPCLLSEASVQRVARGYGNFQNTCYEGEWTPGVISQDGQSRTAGEDDMGDLVADSRHNAMIRFAEHMLAFPGRRPDLFVGKPQLDVLRNLLRTRPEDLEKRLTDHLQLSEIDYVFDANGDVWAKVPGEPKMYQRVPTSGPKSVGIVRPIRWLPGGENSLMLPHSVVGITSADYDIDSWFTLELSRDHRNRLHTAGTRGRGNEFLLLLNEAVRDVQNANLFFTPLTTKTYDKKVVEYVHKQRGPQAPLYTPEGSLAIRTRSSLGEKMVGIFASWAKVLPAINGKVWLKPGIQLPNIPGLALDLRPREDGSIPNLISIQEDLAVVLQLALDNLSEDGKIEDLMITLPTVPAHNLLMWAVKKMDTQAEREDARLAIAKYFLQPAVQAEVALLFERRKTNPNYDWIAMREKQKDTTGVRELFRAANELYSIQKVLNIPYTPIESPLEFQQYQALVEKIKSNSLKYFDTSGLQGAEVLDVSYRAMEVMNQIMYPRYMLENTVLARELFQDKAESLSRDHIEVRDLNNEQAERTQDRVWTWAALSAVLRKMRLPDAQAMLGQILPTARVSTDELKAWQKQFPHNRFLEAMVSTDWFRTKSKEDMSEREQERRRERLVQASLLFRNLPEEDELRLHVQNDADKLPTWLLDRMMLNQLSNFGFDRGNWSGSYLNLFGPAYLKEFARYVRTVRDAWDDQSILKTDYAKSVRSDILNWRTELTIKPTLTDLTWIRANIREPGEEQRALAATQPVARQEDFAKIEQVDPGRLAWVTHQIDSGVLDGKTLYCWRHPGVKCHGTWIAERQAAIRPQAARITVQNVANPQEAAAKDPNGIYIGRPSRWGNPFSGKGYTQAIITVASSQESTEAYGQWLASGTTPEPPETALSLGPGQRAEVSNATSAFDLSIREVEMALLNGHKVPKYGTPEFTEYNANFFYLRDKFSAMPDWTIAQLEEGLLFPKLPQTYMAALAAKLHKEIGIADQAKARKPEPAEEDIPFSLGLAVPIDTDLRYGTFRSISNPLQRALFEQHNIMNALVFRIQALAKKWRIGSGYSLWRPVEVLRTRRAELPREVGEAMRVLLDLAENVEDITDELLSRAEATVNSGTVKDIVNGVQRYRMVTDDAGHRFAVPAYRLINVRRVKDILAAYDAERAKHPELVDWRQTFTEMRAQYRLMLDTFNNAVGEVSGEYDPLFIDPRMAYSWHRYKLKEPDPFDPESARAALLMSMFNGRSEASLTPEETQQLEDAVEESRVYQEALVQAHKDEVLNRSREAENRVREASGREYKRTFKTYYEAALAGYEPYEPDGFNLLTMYAKEVGMVVRNKIMGSIMIGSTDRDGKPAMLVSRAAGDFKNAPTIFSREALFSMLENLRQYILQERKNQNVQAKTLPPLDRDRDPWIQIRELLHPVEEKSYALSPTDLKNAGYVMVHFPKPEGVLSNRLNVSEVWVQSGAAHKVLMHIASRGIADWKMEEGAHRQFIGTAIQIAMAFNSFSKHVQLGFSFFHHFSQVESFLGGIGAWALFTPSGIRRLKAGWYSARRLLNMHPDEVEQWIKDGLDMSMDDAPDQDKMILDTTLRKLQDAMAKVPGLRPVAASTLGSLRYMKRINDHFLWNYFQPTLKVQLAQQLFIEARMRYPGISDRELRRDIANLMNDLYGGQNWAEYLWATPTARDIMRSLVFAPDWTLSAINSARLGEIYGSIFNVNVPIAKPSSSPFPSEFLRKQYWPAFAYLVMMGLPNLIQLLFYTWNLKRKNPDPNMKPFTFMNEEDKKFSIDITPAMDFLGFKYKPTNQRRAYIRWGKQALELVREITNPVESSLGKSSSTMKVLLEQLFGKNSAWWDMPWADKTEKQGGSPDWLGLLSVDGDWTKGRVASFGRYFLPMSIVTALDGRPSTFFAPASLGLNKTRAQIQMVAIMSMYADDDYWSKIQGIPHRVRRMEELVPEVIEALELNGYDKQFIKRLVAQAAGIVRGRLQAEFSNEVQKKKPDLKQLEEIELKAIRLNAVAGDVNESLRMRQKIANMTPAAKRDEARKLREAWKKAMLTARKRAVLIKTQGDEK